MRDMIDSVQLVLTNAKIVPGGGSQTVIELIFGLTAGYIAASLGEPRRERSATARLNSGLALARVASPKPADANLRLVCSEHIAIL